MSSTKALPFYSLRHASRALLAATVALPAVAFLFGTRERQIAFVLYREPKLAAIQILGWSLIATLFWADPERFRRRPLLSILLRPPWRWLALFLAYGLATALWVAVPANLFYELSQYLLLLVLVLSLELWADRDPVVPKVIEGALVASLGAATVVGWLQGAFPLAVLRPIDPGSGVVNPSFLGYKNPMALALVGQIFLAVHQFVDRGARWRRGRLLLLLIAAELVYLVTLKSRTAYVALAGAVVFAGILYGARERLAPRILRTGIAGTVAVALLMGALAADPGARKRVESVLSYLRHPTSYLESDRGTYLLNSLEMVRHHPLGVGFGDWQTQYPVYRLHRRALYFSAAVQVRKAHSDHVQTLAETGWPGFVLWAGFWISLMALPFRGYLRSGDLGRLLLAAQIAAFGLAMSTDYVTEHPYLKFELILVAFLAARRSRLVPEPPPAPSLSGGRSWRAAWVVTILAVAAIGYSACLVRKAALAAAMTESYVAAVEHQQRRDGGPELDSVERSLLEEASRAGRSLASLPGYTKGLSDDYRVLARIELRLGHRRQALTYALASLRLHPYSPNTLWLMADLLRDPLPVEAAKWSRAADYVMYEATGGFLEPYPAVPD